MSYIKKVRIGTKRINEIIQNINLFISNKNNVYFHIANLNPEIFVYATKDREYRRIINNADEILIDGIGISLLARITGVKVGEKLAGTDLMIKLIDIADKRGKKVLLLGGFYNSAEKTAQYFQKKHSSLKIFFTAGVQNIKSETKQENKHVLKYIEKLKPDFLFVAYGPPWQERWIYKNKDKLDGIVCMGVGGSFNFFSNIVRAPLFIRSLSLEWLWRFIFEPKRFVKKIFVYIYFFIYSVFFFLIKRVKITCFSLIKKTIIKINILKK
jgi:N-acetylglucosaminyldiphosphoundecaprenol N-acetyl-beta-D-mannosaminyltransferase